MHECLELLLFMHENKLIAAYPSQDSNPYINLTTIFSSSCECCEAKNNYSNFFSQPWKKKGWIIFSHVFPIEVVFSKLLSSNKAKTKKQKKRCDKSVLGN